MVYNTIFDDVFRTIVEKMPQLVIPLLNEVFGTAYPEDAAIIQLRNEHQDESGEKITDSCLQIGSKLYHIECQSEDDTTMTVRMVQYDFAIGIEHARKENRRYRIELPRSCVLYLRSSSHTPDYLEADLVLPDERTFVYRIPTIKMAAYTKDELLGKNLLMLLPFYIMRYEKHTDDYEQDPEKLKSLLTEYEDIRIHLEKEATEAGRSALYADLSALIVKMANYIFRRQATVKKGIGDVMGGKILELESERLFNAGKKAGIAEGKAEGIAEGKAEGKAEGIHQLSALIQCLMRNGRMDDIALVTRDSKELDRLLRQYGITGDNGKCEMKQ